MTKLISQEERINLSNKLYPLYDGLSKDLLFYIAIDTLFLTVAKGFTAVQISLLGFVPTLVCVLLKPVLLKAVKKLGNVQSSRVGTFMLLSSAVLITFGTSFYTISIGRVIYESAFVLKSMESITLKKNLEHHEKANQYMKIRGASNTVYATATFIIAIVAGPMFNVSPYLPMWLCILFCMITFGLSFTFYEVKDKADNLETKNKPQECKEKKGSKKNKLSKILFLALISNALFINIVFVGQQDSKLFIQYQLTDWYGITTTATLLTLIVASSRLSRIVLNMLFNRFYQRFSNQVPIVLSGMLVAGFLAIILGAVLPASNIIKVLLMTLGFDLIIPMRDTFIIYIEDVVLSNSKKEQQQELFTNMEVAVKVGKVAMNLAISLLLLKVELYYVMWMFVLAGIAEVFLSRKIVKLTTKV